MSIFTKRSEETGHVFDWNNVEILQQENHRAKREFAEMVYISLQKRGLNIMNDTQYLYKPYSTTLETLIRAKRI